MLIVIKIRSGRIGNLPIFFVGNFVANFVGNFVDAKKFDFCDFMRLGFF